MQLIVTTNWDEKFLDGLDPNVVKWVSGRLPRDSVGGSSILPANMLRKVNKKGVEKYIKEIHKRKMRFNYLLDGHCTGNKEYGWHGADEMLKTIKWISDSGADGITTTLPHLVQVIKNDYPELKVGFGGSRVIWEMTRVKYFDSLGVDWIILHITSNRSFKLLKALRKAVDCQLWLVANTGCLFFCNLGYDHDNFLAHASNYTAKAKDTDYFNLNCSATFLKRTEEFIKCPWIRPEDIFVYEKIGYDKFIIYPNSSDTKSSLGIINAYKNRSYDGNLTEILSAIGKKICQGKDGKMEKAAPFLDNKRLREVIDFFVNKKEDCARSLCEECGYCKSVVDKVIVEPDFKQRKSLIKKYEEAIERIEDGR